MATLPSGFTNNGAINTKSSGILGKIFGVPQQLNTSVSQGFHPTPTVPASQPKLGNTQGLLRQPEAKTALKKTTTNNVDGSSTTHEYHAPTPADDPSHQFNTDTGKPNPNWKDPSTTSTTTTNNTPQVGNTGQNYQNVLNSGQQTGNEAQTQSGVLNAGQFTPEEKRANEEVARANELQKSYQNVAALSPYAEAGMYSDRARTPEEIQALQQAPDLTGRANSTYGVTNSLSNIYGSSRVAGANAALQGIQTQAARNLSAQGTAYSGSQNQASRATGAAGTVAGASLPGQLSGSTRLFDPLAPIGKNGSIETGVNNQSKYDLLIEYNNGKATLNQASGIESQILNTLQSNPTLNNQPLSGITNLNEFLAGQSSQPGQQLLSQQVNNYIQTLGLDPASVANIAHQQNGTLAQLLQSLKATAINNNEALKKTADSLEDPSSNSSSDSTGEKTSAGGFNFKLVNGQWVVV